MNASAVVLQNEIYQSKKSQPVTTVSMHYAKVNFNRIL